jgi:hypothetical protein
LCVFIFLTVSSSSSPYTFSKGTTSFSISFIFL